MSGAQSKGSRRCPNSTLGRSLRVLPGPPRLLLKIILPRVLVLLIVAALQLTPAHAMVVAELIGLIKGTLTGERATTQAVDPTRQADFVRSIRLCPRHLVLHPGENFNLVPVPLDANKQIVHGAGFDWSTNDQRIAGITSVGEVIAVGPGRTHVEARAGSATARVSVEVRVGPRPKLADRARADEEWDREHANDCDDPEKDPPDQRVGSSADRKQIHVGTNDDLGPIFGEMFKRSMDSSPFEQRRGRPTFAALASRPGSLKPPASEGKTVSFATTAASLVEPLMQSGGYPDGDLPDVTSLLATAPFNVVGDPRFEPLEPSQASAAKTKNNLGSYNYSFSAPIAALGGRGIGVNLALTCNSRVWNKETNGGMTFNYQRGWPATGWTLGYGRVIENYDGLGNLLLVQPDGTRVHLFVLSATEARSTDGSFILYNPNNGKLRYPDGTLVDFDLINGRVLPAVVRTRNGDQITIAYRPLIKNSPNPNDDFPFRWAINTITDTLGRVVQFNYDPTSKRLVSITAKDQGGASDRVLCQIAYTEIPLQYSFQPGMTIDAPAPGTAITVVRRIYYPATGRGYVMADYSSYGMARKISTRIGMTAGSDGTEVAYTRYDYPDVSTQIGLLNDAPQFTHRFEWWQDKIDGAAETSYTYSRSEEFDPTVSETVDVSMVTHPNNLDVVTKSFKDSGFVYRTEWKSGSIVLRKLEQSYIGGPGTNPQISQVLATDDAGATSKTTYDYLGFGRVENVNEFAFSSSIQRRTKYSYSDDAGLLGQNMVHVVTSVEVRNGSNQKVAGTTYEIDNYGTAGLLNYGSTAPNHDYTNFGPSHFIRGNVTRMTMEVTPNGATISRNMKYDVFGNVIEADVSCCKVKTTTFSSLTWFSQPDSVTDGTPNVAPFLTTSFGYDFWTGLLLSSTDPNGQITSFFYDSAWRPQSTLSPTGATTTTEFDKNANGDLLSYLERVTYTDGTATKTITSWSWLDGVGRVIRTGTGSGANPTAYDAVAIEYDAMGRVNRQSNPYLGDSSGIGSPSFWTSNEYDALSRVKKVTLPDLQTIQTNYEGALVTVTDQVGRKRRSQVDGLGRLIAVTEQDPANGNLSVVTNYAYDTLDNLTQVNQGGQTRSFSYDSLSRLTSQTTPEGGTVGFTYTDFGAALKRTDARNVEAHYKYDSLNRLTKVWYTGLGGDDEGSVRPGLPAGVASTSDVDITYNTAAPGNGAVASVVDGQGIAGFSTSESFTYDGVGRVASRTRTIDGIAYTTQYPEYNQASQLKLMVYPSGKRVRMNYDSRGRLSGEDNVDAAGAVLASYVSSIGYNVAGQVTGMTLGNGVTETFSYNNDRLQLTQQKAMKGTTTLMELNYNYQAQAGESGVGTTAGASGQLMRISSASTINGQLRGQDFTYDNLGRLVTATGWGTWQRRFSYDRWGNRTGVWDATSGGNQLQNILIAKTNNVENNRILSVNSVSFGYDATGNLTSDGAHTYQYDAAGRLARVDAGTASEASYFYDANNQRVKKMVGGVTTVYIWEGSRVIAEYSTASPQGGGGVKFYNADRLSTRVTTNNSGTVTGTQSHLPFGEDAGSVGEVEKHRFTNYERDENGSDYAVNRQYGNASGRFLRPDPVAGSPANPQSLNRYSYSVNDPINLLDPTGLMGFDIDAWWNAFFNPAGLYLDGQRVPEGLDGLAWGLLRGGGGDIGPFWAWTNPRGEWVVDDQIVPKSRGFWLLPGSVFPQAADQPSSLTQVQYQISTDPYFDTITRVTAAAIRRIQDRKPCRELLSGLFGDPAEALETLWKNRKIRSGDPGDGNVAYYNGLTDRITLDVKLFFEDRTVGRHAPGFRLERFEAQQLVLLHEIGHRTSFFPRHKTDEASIRYDEKIYEACF